MAYTRLTQYDRKIIERLREKWQTWREIWAELWKDHSVLSREYKRNKCRWWIYDAKKANQKAKSRTYWKRKKSNKIRWDTIINNYILDKLEQWWSAEAVANRRDFVEKFKYQKTETISWRSIRRYIYGKYWSYIKIHLQWLKMLKKYKKNSQLWSREWWSIKNRVFINNRPDLIWTKNEFWHYECDFIVSCKWDKTVILVLIEKFSRYKIWVLLNNKESLIVKNTLLKLISIHQIKSITFDNDTSFALHYELGIPTYFCHTYSSWEKWQVEKWNVWYRKFLPKWTVLADYNQIDIDEIVERNNSYPLACLEYLTPNEVYNKQFWKFKQEFSIHTENKWIVTQLFQSSLYNQKRH